mgnify:CR=1 FL=1
MYTTASLKIYIPDYKVVEFKGFGNGFSNTLYFERRENIWQLIRFEDLSD